MSFLAEGEEFEAVPREDPPKLVYMLLNKVTGRFHRRKGCKTPAVWTSVQGAINCKSGTAGYRNKDLRIVVFEVKT